MFDVLKSGGILMIPILLCGVFATFIIIERIFFFVSLKRCETNIKIRVWTKKANLI